MRQFHRLKRKKQATRKDDVNWAHDVKNKSINIFFFHFACRKFYEFFLPFANFSLEFFHKLLKNPQDDTWILILECFLSPNYMTEFRFFSKRRRRAATTTHLIRNKENLQNWELSSSSRNKRSSENAGNVSFLTFVKRSNVCVLTSDRSWVLRLRKFDGFVAFIAGKCRHKGNLIVFQFNFFLPYSLLCTLLRYSPNSSRCGECFD